MLRSGQSAAFGVWRGGGSKCPLSRTNLFKIWLNTVELYIGMFGSVCCVAHPGLLHTYSVPTYAHGLCVYIVIDGGRKERGRDGE